MSKLQSWEEFEKELNITPEEEEEIRLEMELIEATIKARKSEKISQEELSRRSGLKQSAIARVERGTHSPSANTLIRMLHPMGYTLKVVPLKNTKISKTKTK